MEEQKRLTMEFVKSLMDKSYTLVWVGYNDNFDHPEVFGRKEL